MSGWATAGSTNPMRSTAIEYKEDRVPNKRRANKFNSKNEYWKWFVTFGRNLFKDQYGEDYQDNRPDHNRFITEIWERVKEAPGGWADPMSGIAAAPRPRQASPPPQPKKITVKSARVARQQAMGKPRRKNFMRCTGKEVDIRAGKVIAFLTSKLKIIMSTGVGFGHRDEDDVLRDLRCFYLTVHEYTSNIPGNRVAPAEVTLLTYSLSRGMQSALSKIVKYKQSLVNEKENLGDTEYDSILESATRTGIAVDRLSSDREDTADPGREAVNIERVKSELLEYLTEQSSKNAPIMVKKDNYNEAAGMLFTLFPDFWERLEARICFIDDMFKIYANVQTAPSDYHPIRDYQNVVFPPACAFHQRFESRGERKQCTQQNAVRELQYLFKNLADARVLKMEKYYDPNLHQYCQDTWDQNASRGGPQISWDDDEREERQRKKDELRGSTSDDDSDDDFGGMPIISTQRSQPSAYSGMPSQSRRDDDGYARREEYGSSSRRDDGSQASSGGYGRQPDFGRSADFGREATKENWQQEQQKKGSTFGNSWKGGAGTSASFAKQSNSGPPPGFEDTYPGAGDGDARPAQRRRAASPTHSDRGGRGGGWNSDRRSDSQGSIDDVRGDGSGVGRAAGGRGGGAGVFSRPRGGGGVFGNRPPAVEPQPEPAHDQDRRAPQQPAARLERYHHSFAGSDSIPVSAPIPGNEEQRRRAHAQRLEQKRERDERLAAEREAERRGERPTARERSYTPPRADKRREDRLNPVFGGGEPRSGSSAGFFGRGVAPALNVPYADFGASKREEKRKETPEEAADRREDEKIASSIKLLPRGAFDAHMAEMARKSKIDGPRFGSTFRPYLWSASKESGGMPMTPKQEDDCTEEITHRINMMH